MAKGLELRVTIDQDVKAGLDALAKATGRQPGAIVEQALRLLLDPVPVLTEARALLVAHQQERIILADKIDLIADALMDRLRASDRAEQDA
jgi:hypothetical protein